MKKLYEYSTSNNTFHRSIFWGSLVLINSIPGLILSIDLELSLVGKLLGILVWLLIYVFIVGNSFPKIKSKIFQKSMYYAYMFKTLSVFLLFGFYLDFFIGIYTINLNNSDQLLGVFEKTLFHGFILSIFTLILGSLIFIIYSFINKLRKNKYKQ